MEKLMTWLRRNIVGRGSPLTELWRAYLSALVTLGLGGCAAVPAPAIREAALYTSLTGFFMFFTGFIAIQFKASAEAYSSQGVKTEFRRLRTWVGRNAQEAFFLALLLVLTFLFCSTSLAGDVRIPGTDESAKLKAAGTLLMLVDTALFVWLARVLAGICIFTAGWLIKEQKLGPAIVCILGALLIGTSPMWVQNIFEISGGGGVFGN